jgi:hypothetical protein
LPCFLERFEFGGKIVNQQPEENEWNLLPSLAEIRSSAVGVFDLLLWSG